MVGAKNRQLGRGQRTFRHYVKISKVWAANFLEISKLRKGRVTMLETVAKFAPIGTALIALCAALIALNAIRAQRDIARRRAAIDFFLKIETDKTMIDLYNKFKEKAPAITSVPQPEDRSDYNDIRMWLNICELIAVGVRKGAFSKRVSFDYWGDVIPKSYRTAERLIDDIRNNPEEGSQHSYVDLEKLAKKWNNGTPGGTMRRGFFRLWLVLSIIWFATGAWLLWDDLTGNLRPEELAASQLAH
jgi:uncharacterized protein DUF4760